MALKIEKQNGITLTSGVNLAQLYCVINQIKWNKNGSKVSIGVVYFRDKTFRDSLNIDSDHMRGNIQDAENFPNVFEVNNFDFSQSLNLGAFAYGVVINFLSQWDTELTLTNV